MGLEKRTQELSFWRKRLIAASKPIDAIGEGFKWELIDGLHRKIILEYANAESKVLDVGCGIGRTADWFNDEVYTGFDFVPEFIDIAKKTHPKKKFLVHNIIDPLPFEDNEFDVAILLSVRIVIGPVIGWGKWEEVEKELKRVAGKVIMLEYGASDPEEILKHVVIL